MTQPTDMNTVLLVSGSLRAAPVNSSAQRTAAAATRSASSPAA